jgi:hypothetical protein
MPKFDAGQLAESLEFDFRGAGVDAHGTIPEPSDKQIGTYLDEVATAFKKIGEVAGLANLNTGDPQAMLAALEKIDATQFVAVLDDISKAAAKLCGGTPSLVQIRALPLRVRQHFFRYLQEEIVRPEAAPGAGNVVAITQPRAAAG